MKSNKYAVGEEWMIFDEEENKWVEGTITEVGDETFCIKWQDLSEETEYRIDDAPRIFPANADKGINHPLYEVLRKFIQDYPSVAPSLHQVDRWVRVEDGLPEHMQQVLFHLASDEMKFGRYYEADQWDRKNMFVCNQGAFFSTKSVVAWQIVSKPTGLARPA